MLLHLRDALLLGWRRALQLQWLLPLYLFGALLGLVQGWPLFGSPVLHNPLLDQIAANGLNGLIDLALSHEADFAAGAGRWALLGLLLLPLYSLGYSFFSGGILCRYAGSHSFWRGCFRFGLPFVLLSILLFVLVIICAILISLIIAVGSWQLGLVIGILLLRLINLLGEYSRAFAIAHDQQNSFVCFGKGCSFVVRHFPGVIILSLLGLLLMALIGALYVSTFSVGGILAIVLQQIIVLAWLWSKQLRLTWALSYIQETETPDRLRIGVPDAVVI